MRPASPFRHALAAVAVMILILVGCDQQQPLAQKPPPDPGFKQGETPPVEPATGPARTRDGDASLPTSAAPSTSGGQSSPAAPAPQPPPPTSSPTEAPVVIPPTPEPPAKEPITVVPRSSTSSSDDQTALSPGTSAATATSTTSTQRDQFISSAIYRAIASQPGLSPDGSLITINTIEGEVTLHGSVTSDAERDQIAALAGQVAGVRSIKNQLDLNGP